MKFLNKIPNRIISRGANYYLEDRVKDLHQLGYGAYSSIVEGNEDYKVTIDVNHPSWSICTCPHYNDGNVCKHIVATYFAIIDDEAQSELLVAERINTKVKLFPFIFKKL